MEQRKQRLRYIDIAKGIGIISIVLGHLSMPIVNQFVFTYHIPIFYLIAGYFLTDKSTNIEFIKKRIQSLLIPYYFTCLLILLFFVLKTMIFYHGIGLLSIVSDYIYASLYAAGDNYQIPFYIKGIGAIWFLWALFWAEIILRKLLDYSSKIRALCVFCIFFIGLWTKRFFWFPLSIQAGCCALLFVYMGYLIHQFKDCVANSGFGEIKSFIFLFSLCMWGWFIKNFNAFWLVHGEIGNGFAGILGSLCACCVLINVVKWMDIHTEKISMGLSFFGRYSLLFLSYHIIELDVFQWDIMFGYMNGHFPNIVTSLIWFKIIGKFIWIVGMLLLTYRMSFIKKVYGYK